MKKSIFLPVIALALVLVLPPPDTSAQKSQSAEVLLGAALHQEEVEGNLEAAIATYKKLIAAYPDNRPLAAEAQFRIGMCYEKLGRREAQKAYEDVLAKYTDQSAFVAKARERLTALSGIGSKVLTARKVENAPGDVALSGAISPDGRYLTCWDEDTEDLSVRDLQTGQSRRLTMEATGGAAGSTFRQSAGASAWSSDSKQVTYVWYIAKADITNAELRVVSIEGGKPRVLARFEGMREMSSLAWSPDGKYIAACVFEKSGLPRIGLVSTADGSLRTLVQLKREIYPTTLRFSPDSRHIAYDRLPDVTSPDRDIYLISLDTGEDAPLIQHPADDYLLGWSRDGQWLIFASDRTGVLGLWIVGVAGTKTQGNPTLIKPGIGRILPVGLTQEGTLYYGIVRVTEDVFTIDLDLASGKTVGPSRKAIERYEGGNFSPSFSQDGKFLAYVSRRGNSPYPTNVGNALCILSLDTGAERVFYKELWRLGSHFIDGPDWSPDGRFIVVRGSEEGVARRVFYRLDLETDKITPIVHFGPDSMVSGSGYGSEGRYFYIHRNQKEDITKIVALDFASGTERELYRFPSLERGGGISLSPDKKQLAFANFGWGAIRSLRVMLVSGGEAREIWNFGKMEPGVPPVSFCWAPDGRYILFSAPDPSDLRVWNLWRVPSEGGTPEKMGFSLIWGLWGLTVRPDGRQLAFAGRSGPSTDSELWVLENFLPVEKK